MAEPIDDRFEEYIDPNEASPFELISELQDALLEIAEIISGGE